MRIGFIVENFPALSETFILNQMIGLMDTGHEIRIFASKRGQDIVIHEEGISIWKEPVIYENGK